MKWVLKTSSIIVGSDEGSKESPDVFRSVEECPPRIRKRLRDTLSGRNACTIMITNREGLKAIQSGTFPNGRRSMRQITRAQEPRQPLVLPRWQLAGLALLAAMAATVGMLVWAMHGT